MSIANRMNNLGTETAFEVLAKAKALEARGIDVVHLEIGEPDFNTPSHIIEEAVLSLRDGDTHYGPAAGLPELRTAIADNIKSTRSLAVDPDQVVITPGGKPIIFFTILALAQPGDEVIYPNPGFPIYESMIRFCGATPVPVRLLEDEGFHIDLDDLAAKISNRTKLLILNSPHNPTGSIISTNELKIICELLEGREDLYVLSDEIYKDIVYEDHHTSIASFPDMADRTIILDGFSKSYAMTGWRLGYGIFPESLTPHIVKLATNSVSCAATFSQRAAIHALKGPQHPVNDMVAEFNLRRDIIVEGLNRIPGIICHKPEGAFYVFPSARGTGITSQAFQDLALTEAGVAVLAGTSFGVYGEGYVRLSYANSQDNIQKALTRLGEFVKTHTV